MPGPSQTWLIMEENPITINDASLAIPPRGWALGLGRHLPAEIAVRRAAVVPEGFSPRFGNLGTRAVKSAGAVPGTELHAPA